MAHLVQVSNGSARRVALVDGPNLRCLSGTTSVYELAQKCAREAKAMAEYSRSLATGETLNYDDIYQAKSQWSLLAPIDIDIPGNTSKLLVSGTGLTHLGSAKERQAMHVAGQPKKDENITDSMRMFQWGVTEGRPEPGKIGIAPEWFYKGDGSVLRAPFEALEIPGHAEDGGEEAEVAGVYLVDENGVPNRIGMTVGNEFSDHKFERRNYLNLAASKLRTCSLGPELVLGEDFQDVKGSVRIERAGATLWSNKIATGEHNMCHSLANIEHHHFKFAGHRQPGTVHVHFYGADALSFGDGLVLQDGDWMEVQFEGFGRALRNPVRQAPKQATPTAVRNLA